MRVLFLVGNGFDCNLGLKTTYKAFYPYYINRFPDDRLANSIKNDYEKWSDLELGLGAYLSEIDKSEIDKFYNEKGNIETCLTEYLINEKKRISFGVGLKEEFLKNLQSLPKELSRKDARDMSNWINSVSDSIHYGFISFNYTNILSMIVDLPYKGTPILSHTSKQRGFNDVLDKPIYIHGSLEDRIILGVNDKTQIKNELIANDPNESAFMIKNDLNNQIGELRWEDAKASIDNSQYIFVYGMSLGDTDKNYWKYLYDWLLKKDRIHKLVLCAYTTNTVKLSATDYSRQQQRYRNQFIKATGIKNPDETVLMDIIVVHNPSVFNFSNITLKDEVKKDEK